VQPESLDCELVSYWTVMALTLHVAQCRALVQVNGQVVRKP